MVQPIVLSYPLPFSMLHPGGIDRNKMISTNIVKLKLQTLIKIHPVVNISQVVRYRKPVEEQKVVKEKPIEIEKVEK